MGEIAAHETEDDPQQIKYDENYDQLSDFPQVGGIDPVLDDSGHGG